MKRFLSGNEAIARGAYEAGVHVATSYPGTPATEILENLALYEEVDAQWSTNEKVAFDVAYGASLGGARSLVSVKHVGLNVASDPMMTTALAGVGGGMVIVNADDPGMHSSQNEQDNRYFAKFAKIPMLEPSDSQEAKELVKLAFGLSEEFNTPVLVRSTTRISHSKSLVELGEREEVPIREYQRNARRHVVPIYGKLWRKDVEERLGRLQQFAESFSENRIEGEGGKLGIITSGIAYQYAKEVFPQAKILKLGMTYPLAREKILSFVADFDRVHVVEELEPFLEEQIRSWGASNLVGKEAITNIGELSPEVVSSGITGEEISESYADEIEILARPPVMCAGCPHAGLFYTLRKLKVTVTGDIGCYTLGALPPHSAIHTTFCMGAGIGNAFGLEKAQKEGVVAVIGDSTFLHTGIPALIDIVFNKGITTVVICDNLTTGMTGHQPHPGTGRTAKGEPTYAIDYEELIRAIGIKHTTVVDPYNLKETEEVMKEAINLAEPTVVISRHPCRMLPEERSKAYVIHEIDEEKCNACNLCFLIGCPSLEGYGERPRIIP
ncbi:MAG: indolepyruvate ferredoxin oxidoreductase, partial [candidate division Zixibacteria bacterium DG_27]